MFEKGVTPHSTRNRQMQQCKTINNAQFLSFPLSLSLVKWCWPCLMYQRIRLTAHWATSPVETSVPVFLSYYTAMAWMTVGIRQMRRIVVSSDSFLSVSCYFLCVLCSSVRCVFSFIFYFILHLQGNGIELF